MRYRIAALTGAGVMIAALGAATPAAAGAQASLPAGAQASMTCGTWRWPVKTGSDATRYQVSRTTQYTGVN